MTQKRWLMFVGVLLLSLVISAAASAQKFDLNFEDLDYAQIYRALGERQGLNVLVDPAVQGRTSITLKDVTFEEALNLISQHTGYAYRIEGNTLLVATHERLQELEKKAVRYVEIEVISREEVMQALALIMSHSDVYVAPEGGVVVLHGTEEVLDQAEELLLMLDESMAAKIVPDEDKTLLAIFKDLSAEMGLNLVADPSLEKSRLYVDIRVDDPEAVIEQIKELVPLNVQVTEEALIVSALDAPSTERIKVYRLNYLEPEMASEALTVLVAADSIRIDEEQKSVVVRANEHQLARIDEFMADFDQPLPQVVLEVWVQEVAVDAMDSLGVDWEGLLSFRADDSTPVFFKFDWEAWDLILALRALEERGDSKVLARPKVTTLSGQPARVFVGDRVPIVLRREDGSHDLEFLESGINLKVTPRISADDYITILVEPEVSTFVWKPDTQYPQIRTREAETTVRVKDGQPIVLGGLIQEQEDEIISRIPFISQLPVLGKLFEWRQTKKTRTEMTIFLIPRIIHGEKDLVIDDSFFPPAQ